MRYPRTVIDDITSRISLSDVVGRHVTWDRKKSNQSKRDYWACCPFHNEKTASFHVDDNRQLYHCFGCGVSGSHIQFLIDIERLSFIEAVEKLAREAGVTLPDPDPHYKEKEAQRNNLFEVCELACQFFEKKLTESQGVIAKKYLEERGIKPETIKEFRIGFAPSSNQSSLKEFLLQKKIEESKMLEAGLIVKPDEGGESYDKFRERIIFPIQNREGKVVAFGGRTLKADGIPKYLNSPETPLFKKRDMLFNFHRVKQHSIENKGAIVVEGYMDAIVVWQAGIKNVVASLGTSFTEQQISQIWNLSPEPTLCLDGDSAGTLAAQRAVDRIIPFLKSGYSFNFVFLPAGKDPDDLIQAKGADGLNAELNKSIALSQVLWDRETTDARIDTPERKAALEKKLYSLVAQIKDETVKRRYHTELRLRLSSLFWNHDRVNLTGGPVHKATNKFFGGKRVQAPLGDLFAYERTICALCINYSDMLEKYIERVAPLHFEDELHQNFIKELCRIVTEFSNEPVVNFFNQLDKSFFKILNEVISTKKEGGVGAGEAERLDCFSLLEQRLPVLKFEPKREFVERLFLHYLDKLELRSLEQEILQSGTLPNGKLQEEDWNRIQALTLEVEKLRETFRRDEEVLELDATRVKTDYEKSGISSLAIQ